MRTFSPICHPIATGAHHALLRNESRARGAPRMARSPWRIFRAMDATLVSRPYRAGEAALAGTATRFSKRISFAQRSVYYDIAAFHTGGKAGHNRVVVRQEHDRDQPGIEVRL